MDRTMSRKMLVLTQIVLAIMRFERTSRVEHPGPWRRCFAARMFYLAPMFYQEILGEYRNVPFDTVQTK